METSDKKNTSKVWLYCNDCDTHITLRKAKDHWTSLHKEKITPRFFCFFCKKDYAGTSCYRHIRFECTKSALNLNNGLEVPEHDIFLEACAISPAKVELLKIPGHSTNTAAKKTKSSASPTCHQKDRFLKIPPDAPSGARGNLGIDYPAGGPKELFTSSKVEWLTIPGNSSKSSASPTGHQKDHFLKIPPDSASAAHENLVFDPAGGPEKLFASSSTILSPTEVPPCVQQEQHLVEFDEGRFKRIVMCEEAMMIKACSNHRDASNRVIELGVSTPNDPQCEVEELTSRAIGQLRFYRHLDRLVRKRVKNSPHPTCLQGTGCHSCGKIMASYKLHESCFLCSPCCTKFLQNPPELKTICPVKGCVKRSADRVKINTLSFQPCTLFDLNFYNIDIKPVAVSASSQQSSSWNRSACKVRDLMGAGKAMIDPDSLDVDCFAQELKAILFLDETLSDEARLKCQKNLLMEMLKLSSLNPSTEVPAKLKHLLLKSKVLGATIRHILNPKDEDRCIFCLKQEANNRASVCGHILCGLCHLGGESCPTCG